MPDDQQIAEESLESSLEVNDTVIGSTNGENTTPTPSIINAVTGQDTLPSYQEPSPTPIKRLMGWFKKINVYLLLFLLILVLVSAAAYVGWKFSKNSTKQASVSGQELSAEDLAKIKNTDTTVGDSKQTLTIASSSVFNSRVLMKDNLDVAGTLRVGGALSLPGITVSGTSTFENVSAAGNLAIAGNTAIQGTLSVQKNLAVSGGASFGGPISAPLVNIDKLILNNDLQINRHIDAGGPTPDASRGAAVGESGTVSASGTDTAGTVAINFGPGSGPGVIANIKFKNTFSQNPHVVITPVGSACADLNYYTSRTTTSFTINSTNSASPGASCSFDYIAID